MPPASSDVRRPPMRLCTAKGMTSAMPYRATNQAPPTAFCVSMPHCAQKRVCILKNMLILQ
jgi:hypothetical protein